MILLDTNVIAEPLRPKADPAIQAWLDRQPREALYLAAPCLMELLLGIALLPEGRRKKGPAAAVQKLLTEFFVERFLSFDKEAAIAYAALSSRASAKGHRLSVADCQIAAIAAVHGFAVATRDTKPFLAAGVQVINPWRL